jgi:hypothetical protein
VLQKKKSIKVTLGKVNEIGLPLSIYLVTVPVYLTRNYISMEESSIFYKAAELLNSLDSIVVSVMIILLIYGFTHFLNKSTVLDLYRKAIAVLEIVYLLSYYITDQFDITECYNIILIFFMGITFCVLNLLRIVPRSSLESGSDKSINIYSPISDFNDLFPDRQKQAEELIKIIKENKIVSGYSICINGKWGQGKTSFVNATLAKLNEDKTNKGQVNKKNTYKNKTKLIYEVRINAMELDDLRSLINYFLIRIKEILDSIGIYVGVSSEYMELITSLSGTIIHESAKDFLSKKIMFRGDDYRDKLEKLNKLLDENLKESRIIIIIDDVDRCSKEKFESFLFFMKEIATMKRCITLFLVDITKLKSSYSFDDSFLDKFFNYTINLCYTNGKTDISKVLKNTTYTKEKIRNLEIEMEKLLKKFNNIINNKENKLINDKSSTKKTDYDNGVADREIIDEARRIIDNYTNPRNVRKIEFEYMIQLNKIESIKNRRNKGEIEDFLNKVDFRKQLLLLSVMSILFDAEYLIMNKGDIYEYFSDIAKKPDNNNYRHIIRLIVEGNWYKPTNSYTRNNAIDETKHFIYCLLKNIKYLPIIAAGKDPTAEEYIIQISNGSIRIGEDFVDIFDKIYMMRFHYDNKDFEKIIDKLFRIYLESLDSKIIDSAFDLLKNSKFHIFVGVTPVLKKFCEVFCKSDYTLEEPKEIKFIYSEFLSNYNLKIFDVLYEYFSPLFNFYNYNTDIFDEPEGNFSYDAMGDMNDFEKRFCEYIMDFISENDEDKLNKPDLKQLFCIAEEKYKGKNIQDYEDIKQAKDDAEKIMNEIDSLYEIEKYIEAYIAQDMEERLLTNYNLGEVIQNLENLLCNNTNKFYDYMQQLLTDIYMNKKVVDEKNYNELNSLAIEYFKKTKHKISGWRRMLIRIKPDKKSD